MALLSWVTHIGVCELEWHPDSPFANATPLLSLVAGVNYADESDTSVINVFVFDLSAVGMCLTGDSVHVCGL